MVSDDRTVDQPSGLQRRDFIKQSAAVGALVWAAPMVRSFSSPAFAGTPQEAGAISYVALVLDCGADGYKRIKYEIDGGSWDPDPGSTPFCDEPEAWSEATSANGANFGITVSGSSTLCFTLPGDSTCTFAFGEDDAVAMGARGEEHPQGKGFCVGPDPGATSRKVCFSDPVAAT